MATTVRRRHGLFALFIALALLLVPATAWGDIYKWTDEQGRISISNIAPLQAGKLKNLEVVLKESKPAATAESTASATEQALLERIQNLERKLQARQEAPPALAPAAPPPAPAYSSYYPPAPPAPVYGSYYPPAPPPPDSFSGDYSPKPASTYFYPVPVYSYSFIVPPRRAFVTRPTAVVTRPAAAAMRHSRPHETASNGVRWQLGRR